MKNIIYPVVICSLLGAGLSLAEEKVVLATDNFKVTTEDFDRYLEEQGLEGDKLTRTLAKEGAVRNVFENIYVIRAFAAKAADNPEIDGDEVDWQVQSYRERLLMKNQLELEVAEALAGQDWEALAEEEYKANKDKYQSTELVSAAHILISTAERDEESASQLADELKKRLDGGESFVDLAKEYSDDPGSRDKGGELGYFPRKRMVKPFEDAVFGMTEPGSISAPVKTQFGYHIIKLIDHKAAGQLSFEEVKQQIIPQIKKRTKQSIRSAKIDAVKSGSVDLGLEVNVELLKTIEREYAPEGGFKKYEP